MASPLRDEIEIVSTLVAFGIARSDFAIHHLDNSKELQAKAVPLLRHWLVAKGVSETQAYSATNYVLANAFRIGDSYIEKMIANNRPKPKNRGFAGRDLAIDLDAPIGKPDVVAADLGGGIPIDAAPIDAQAAEAVLNRALANYRQETQKALLSASTVIETRLGTALDRRWTEAERHFGERTKTLVAETQQMVIDIADRLIPRELVIRTSETVRTLPSETRHEAFDRVLRWLLIGEHVYIVGPAGTGKTHMAKQLASAIGKQLYLPGQALSKYDISGYKGPTGEYFGTIVREALEKGGLLFVDEGDMWAAAALGFLNAPLANGWCAFPDKTIEVHPQFQCMIAANTYGRGATQEYIGRNPLDAASVDRFAFVTVDYDEDMERLLYGNSPWVQYVHRIRQATRDLKLRHVISTRAIQRVLRGVQAGLSVEDICFSSLWRGLDPDTILKIKTQAGEPPRVLKAVLEPIEDETIDETIDDRLSTGTNA